MLKFYNKLKFNYIAFYDEKEPDILSISLDETFNYEDIKQSNTLFLYVI